MSSDDPGKQGVMKADRLTLNQRVQGSNRAPTNYFKDLAHWKVRVKNPCVRTMSESTWQVGDIGKQVEPDARCAQRQSAPQRGIDLSQRGPA